MERERIRGLNYYRAGGYERRFKKEGPAKLERLMHRVIRRSAKRQSDELARLSAAVHRVETRQCARLANILRRRYEHAIKGLRRPANLTTTVRQMIGCTLPQLRTHLESQFQPGMTWKNYGFYGWHIDHKRLVCTFDLRDPAQQAECFHFSNLRPLWARDNLTRSKNKKLQPSRDCATIPVC